MSIAVNRASMIDDIPQGEYYLGRPTSYDPIKHCNDAIELGKKGKSLTQIAVQFGVSAGTIYFWRKRYPEFNDAMHAARDCAKAWYEDQGQLGIWDSKFNGSTWDKQIAARFPEDYRPSKDINIGEQQESALSKFLKSIDGKSVGLPDNDKQNKED